MLYDTSSLIFLSTLSLRRATSNEGGKDADNGNFYPRSPCGERLKEVEKLSRVTVISIHALLAESDYSSRIIMSVLGLISIHALLAESDAAIC